MSLASQRLLYFSPASSGGLADYARAQANALTRLGVKVDLLTTDDFTPRSSDGYILQPKLDVAPRGRSKLVNRWSSARQIMRHYHQLARAVGVENYRHVLLGSYAEYLAPLWSGQLTRLARAGVVFGAVVHDPVRNYVVGPRWWHRQSIASAYSFLREAFVHESIVLDTVRPMPQLRTTVIPHGVYTFPPANVSREQFRRDFGIPESAQVWLSFGHIRDGKNLDLAIRALAHFPDAFLIVAGREQSSGQKPAAFYQNLARQCGVDKRCFWLNRFIAEEEVGNLFGASDLVLLTYSKDFRSASGVLNTAIHFRKPCVASSGQGNIRTSISKYNLGIWIEPDDLDSLIAGFRLWESAPPVPNWEAYEADHSWQRNAEIAVNRMFES